MTDLSQTERCQLGLLRRQYLQLMSPELLAMPPPGALRNPRFQAQIYENLYKPGSLPHDIPGRYKLRVLKELIKRIEGSIVDPEEDEISDDLMSCLTTLLTTSLPPESSSATQKSHVVYTLPSNFGIIENSPSTITLLESRSLISGSGTTGLRTWEAALHLGTYLSSPSGREHIEGKNILELGAGTGLLSILCAKYLGAKLVLATDGDERVVDDLRTNISLNGLDHGRYLDTAVLKWGQALTFSDDANANQSHPYDVILGADIVGQYALHGEF
ncbi:MAG: hypothetical protein M1835_002384 [Candelina submexicana]|nr:MAG: hypothetical protein M1835_002384 [Candelina submexicana]